MKHSMMRALPLIPLLFSLSVAQAEEKESKDVMISHDVKSIEVKHNGKPVEVMREQDKSNEIVEFYRKTTRGKIQAMNPFEPHQVETLGEREVLDYMKKISDGDESILLIDSRTPAWIERSGMIPGAVSIPFTEFKEAEKAIEIMEDQFNVLVGDRFDFSDAKTLVLYCNGVWCGQSPTTIRKILAMGYPAAKIKYYRGGMQSWASLGLTVVKEEPKVVEEAK